MTAHYVINEKGRATARPLHETPLSPWQRSVLRKVREAGEQGITSAEVALQMSWAKQRAGALMGRLQERGLVKNIAPRGVKRWVVA